MNYDRFLLLKFPYELVDTGSPPAEEDIRQAIDAYARFTEKQQNMLTGATFNHDLINGMRRITQAVNDYLASCLLPGRTVRPNIPLVSQTAMDEYFARLDSVTRESNQQERRILAGQVLAAYIYEVRGVWYVTNGIILPGWQPHVLAEFNKYSAWDIGEESKNTDSDLFGLKSLEKIRLDFLRNEVEKLVEEQKERIGTLGAIVNESEKHVSDTVARLEVAADVTQKQIERISGTLPPLDRDVTAILDAINTSAENLEAFKKAVRLEYGTNATKKLWTYRGRWSACSFWISSILLAGCIIGPPWYALTHINTVVDILKEIGDAAGNGIDSNGSPAQVTAAAISRLVVVSAPLALYFWGIKLLVRFNARSMVLMDDARQRHTTMDTYIHLVEKNNAKPAERALMLTALFRPLPGQGPENVEPPNFVDIIGKKVE